MDPNNRVIQFTGKGKGYTAAIDDVATKISNAIICGTFDTNQLYRLQKAVEKRITEVGIHDPNNTNIG